MCRRWPTSNTLDNISASRAFGWVLFDGVAVSAIELVVYDVNHARSTIQLNILGNMNKVVVAGEGLSKFKLRPSPEPFRDVQ